MHVLHRGSTTDGTGTRGQSYLTVDSWPMMTKYRFESELICKQQQLLWRNRPQQKDLQKGAGGEVPAEKDGEVISKKEILIKSRKMNQGERMYGRGYMKEKNQKETKG